MRCRLRNGLLWAMGWGTLLAMTVACSGSGGATAGPPASPSEAATVIDLATFPLAPGAQRPMCQTVAGLSYNVPGTVGKVYESQRRQLTALGWQELPGSYVSEQAASASFARAGFTLSLVVIPPGNDGAVNVSITNHGNVALDALPVPAGAVLLFGGPVSVSYVTAAPVDETVQALSKLLTAQGWEPHGSAGDVRYFKQNAIRLSARVLSAPAQGGRTMIDFSTLLMSTDLPAPVDAQLLQYADATAQLSFDTPTAQPALIDFYRKSLARSAWNSTMDKPVKIDSKDVMIFRNPGHDLLTLELTEVDGKTRVLLKHQSAAEVAELDRLLEAETARRKMELEKPLPKLAVTLPDGAREVEQTKSSIEFKLASGQVQPSIDAWRKQFGDDGWQEESAVLEALAGSISFRKDSQRVSVTYVDAGIVPAEITLQASGVELERIGREASH